MKKWMIGFVVAFSICIATPALADSSIDALLDQAPRSPEWTQNPQVDGKLAAILQEVAPESLPTSQRVHAIYNYLKDSIAYRGLEALPAGYSPEPVPEEIKGLGPRPFYGYDIPQALFSHVGTCEDYSIAFVQLTRAIGLDSITWGGKVRNSDGTEIIHVWPMISLGGQLYIFDPTIDDNMQVHQKNREDMYFGKRLQDVEGTYFVFDANAKALPPIAHTERMQARVQEARSLRSVGVWENTPDTNDRIRLIDLYGKQQPLQKSVVPETRPPAERGILLEVNGVTMQGVEPIIREGRTLVPIRAITEAIGCQVVWQADTQTARITRAGQKIALRAGEFLYDNNGRPSQLDAPLLVENGRLMVPVRVVSEAFGATVKWDPTSQTVRVQTLS